MAYETSGYLREDDASSLSGLSRHYIQQLAQQEQVRAFQVTEGSQRGTWFIHKEDLLEYKRNLEQPRKPYDPRESVNEDDETTNGDE